MSDYAVVDPATGETVKTYPTITDAELDAALHRAQETFTTWSRSTTVAERAALIRRVAELHYERKDELGAIIAREMGKPVGDSVGEVEFSAMIYEYYADNAEAFLADEPIALAEGSEGTAVVRKSPLGVLLGIMPWNFPYYQVARFAGPNLIIGNPVLLKHAPQCPESADAIQQIYLDAGFPEGAYINIYATNDQIATVIGDPIIQGVSLTGSERAGAAVAEIAGRHLKKVVLELGGSDPFILLSTDDMDATVESAVMARIDNCGQACNAAKRFIVIDSLYDEFVEKFTAGALATPFGNPTDPDITIGPLSSKNAADNLEKQVNDAVAAGASIASAGERSGNFYPPAVLTGVGKDNPAYDQELFGPVAMIHKVGSEEEAIELANDTPFGLGSYLFTTDPEQAARVADAIQAGMVYVNIVAADSPELPFGGVKRSGSGRELGRWGADEFVNKKLIRIG
ncbi:MAG: NAD-dependent succinate-semialdehyde dehydrogenase [Nocardioides sp.]